MELDAGTADPAAHEADLCIVGAGPAGLTLAHALAGSGLRIVLIESGDRSPGEARELNSAISTGDPLADLRTSRERGLGGTAAIWNTIRSGAAGAKYVPLDPIDFEPRDELPHSGWPITRETLEPWYRQAYALLGLAPTDGPEHALPRLPFGDAGLTTSVYRWAPSDIFHEAIPAELRRREDITLITNATVTALVATRGVVSAAHWRSLSGAQGTVRAGRFVLACGTIENARLLLASGIVPSDSEAWLGRGLMEHPIDRSLVLRSRHRALLCERGCYVAFGAGERAHLVGRIGCSDAFLRRHRLWNASLRLFRKRERRWKRIIRTLSGWAGLPMAASWRVFTDVEQAPHRDNRVTLSDRVDALGMRRAAVHWRWRAEDEANRQRTLAAIVSEFSASGAGAMDVIPRVPIDPDVHHHAGTTRMSSASRDGVVDADLRVHGMENLSVLGASVFPTGGIANPTLTIVALALRMGAAVRG